jgi:hypothetical protein
MAAIIVSLAIALSRFGEDGHIVVYGGIAGDEVIQPRAALKAAAARNLFKEKVAVTGDHCQGEARFVESGELAFNFVVIA